MLITLLTDFGLQDGYVGIMKGVIKSINPEVDLIDLTHDIPRQNLFAASFVLQNAIDYFPPNTIYLIVVDPGVGTTRKPILMTCERGYFICPNNGLLTGVLSKYEPQQIYQLTNSKYWLNHNISNTFHGRDLFAPITAYLSKGVALEELGESIPSNDLVTLDLPKIEIKENSILGTIQYIDIYGNLITNIPITMVEGKSWYAIVNGVQINSGKTYSSVAQSELVTLCSSHGYLEIASNGGNAQTILKQDYGNLIEVKIDK
jgi:hypothetical protein